MMEPGPAVRRGIYRCAAAAVLFGASAPLASQIADTTSAPVLAGLLYLGAALAMTPLIAKRGIDRRGMRRGGPRLGLAIAFGGFLGPLFLAAGLARTPAATASLLLNLELVATAVLAATFFHEHIGRRVVVGTAAVLMASLVLAWTGSPELRVGAILIVAACVCWGFDNCVTADLDSVRPDQITLAKGVIAGGTNLVLGLALGASLPSGGATVAAIAIGAFGYGLSITLWVTGARDLGAARGQLVFATAPFIGVIVAWVVLGEPVRYAELIALVIGAFGVSQVVGSGHEHEHEHDLLKHDHEHSHDDGHHDHHHPGLVGTRRHSHDHTHEPIVHAHPHVPDLHHRHGHG